MALKIFALFVFMFLLYIPFTRNPDYFDSKFTTATVKETGTNKFIAKFTINGKDTVQFNPAYPLRKLKDNQQIKTIYSTSNPAQAAAYSVWGYWINWKELLILPLGYFILFMAAKAITANPSPEAIKELEEESKKPKIRKPRYDV